MACPYFFPQHRIENSPWPHPVRLPLGAAYTGYCTAAGHEGKQPSDEELKNGCNLGYARNCSRLPSHRSTDAVRFSIARDRDLTLSIQFVCEFAHAPTSHGMLEFDSSTGEWRSPHSDPCIQRMAECYVESYLQRRDQPAAPVGATAAVAGD
jgi:hypothetical protein